MKIGIIFVKPKYCFTLAKKKMAIINFKDTDAVKKAVKVAAAKSTAGNVSKFLSQMVRANPDVAKELKNISKKSLVVR